DAKREVVRLPAAVGQASLRAEQRRTAAGVELQEVDGRAAQHLGEAGIEVRGVRVSEEQDLRSLTVAAIARLGKAIELPRRVDEAAADLRRAVVVGGVLLQLIGERMIAAVTRDEEVALNRKPDDREHGEQRQRRADGKRGTRRPVLPAEREESLNGRFDEAIGEKRQR